MRNTIISLFFGLFCGAQLSANNTFFATLDQASLTGGPGDLLKFFVTLENLTADEIFLNGIGATSASPFLTIDTSPFFVNAPLSLAGGATTPASFEIFDVTIDPAAPDGGIIGSLVTIQGGADGGLGTAFDDLVDITFDVQVQSSVPEPRTFLTLAIGLGVFIWRKRRVQGAVTMLLLCAIGARAQNWSQPVKFPPDRVFYAAAFDTVRGQLVMFGGMNGFSGIGMSDTWVFDGTTWTQKSPATTPPARWGSAMVYDSIRGQVVMFGGYGEGAVNLTTGQVNGDIAGLADTWTWDGTNWTQQAPGSSPPARFLHSMAFDATHGQAVLFGGSNSSPNNFRLNAETPLSDTWLWSGTNWTQSTPAVSPGARSQAAMTFDAANQQVVLFGGTSASINSSFADTWVWDGSTWTHKTPATSPVARSGAGITFDASAQKVLLYGGTLDSSLNAIEVGGAATSQRDSDQWQWDGTNWTRLTPSPSPAERGGMQLVYDAQRQQVVLFAGVSNQLTAKDDTWVWSGGAWSIPVATLHPDLRYQAAVVYDPVHQNVVVVSGASTALLSDTWTWDGTAWTQRTPATAPDHAQVVGVWDAARQVVTMVSMSTMNLWTWDGINWTNRGATGPSQRSDFALSYDALHQQVVLFGGNDGNMLNDTWLWNGASWTQAVPAHSPAARAGASMSYDAANHQVVLFGGEVGPATPVAVNDTWVWDGSDWTQKAPAISPQPRGYAGMSYDSGAAQTILFGGTSQSLLSRDGLADTWVWDGNAWSAQFPATSPPARKGISMTYDALHQSTIIFGGWSANSEGLEDTWVFASRATVALTITVPSGVQYSVSGFPFTGTQTISLPAGPYSLSLISPQAAGPGTQLAFVAWSDGGAQSHTITLGSSPINVTGTFKTQYLLTINVNPANGGAAAPFSPPASAPYYDANAAVIISAAANTNFDFDFWSGGCSGSNPSCLVVMSGPVTVNANFAGTLIWVPLYPATSPPGRIAAGMAYDSARQQVVLFGGDLFLGAVDTTRFSDTWTWNGVTWTQQHPAASPPPLRFVAMTYDAARGQVVLFGGTRADDSMSPDTWVWDGVTWTQKHPASSPTPRAGASLAFDGAHNQIVLFGGSDNTNMFSDTWIWDGANWTQRAVAGPSARSQATATFDAARQNVVLFGGTASTDLNSSASLFSDTWTWDGSAWTKRNPVSTPAARYRAGLAYDSVNQQVAMFSGFGSDFSNQLWLWDGLNWTLKTYAVSPLDRILHMMAFDGARQQIVMFGGTDSPSVHADDTWVYTNVLSVPPQFTLTANVTPANSGVAVAADTVSENGPSYFAASPVQVLQDALPGFEFQFFTGDCSGSLCNLTMNANKSVTASFGTPSNWVDLAPATHPASTPFATTLFPVPIVWDPARQQMVQFGGPHGGQFGNQTWVWDGVTWTQKFPAHVPPGRIGQAMAYDPSRQQVVMFGGTSSTVYDPLGDTWVWDGNDWTQKAVSGPPARMNHQMSWDGQHVMLFGGWSGVATFIIYADTWVWDGNAWSQRMVTGPGARSDFGMVFDAARSQVVLTGGFESLTFETWIWDGSSWTQVQRATTPPGGTNTSSFDSLRQRVVLFAEGVKPPQTWIWDGQFWTQAKPANTPPNRIAAGSAYDPVHDQVILFGGVSDSSSGFADTWAYSNHTTPAQFTLTTSVSPAGSGSVTATPASASYISGTSVSVTQTPTSGYEFEYWSGACSGSTTCNVAMEGNQTVTANYSKPYNWVQELPPGVPTPAPLVNTFTYGQLAMVYDAARQKIMMFGNAYGGQGIYGQRTWIWNPNAIGGAAWQGLSPAHSPSGRAGHGLAYDPVHQVVVLFGGADVNGNPLNDTWIWDGTDWSQRAVAGPPARLNHSMSWDGQRVMLFGGWNLGALLSDTWLWDGNAWTLVPLAVHPTGRSDFGMAYDAQRNNVVLFSGYDPVVADTWIWDGASWTQQFPASSPPMGFNSMAYDAVSHQIVLFDEQLGATPPQTWVWDGSTWLQRALAVAPPKRLGGGLAFSDASGQLVMFGGYTGFNDTFLADTWVWLSPFVTLVPQAPTIAKDGSGNYLVTLTLLNSGNIPMSSIQVNSAKLGATPASSVSTYTFPVGAGTMVSFTATFPPAAGVRGASLPVVFTGAYNAGLTANAPWSASARSILLP